MLQTMILTTDCFAGSTVVHLWYAVGGPYASQKSVWPLMQCSHRKISRSPSRKHEGILKTWKITRRLHLTDGYSPNLTSAELPEKDFGVKR